MDWLSSDNLLINPKYYNLRGKVLLPDGSLDIGNFVMQLFAFLGMKDLRKVQYKKEIKTIKNDQQAVFFREAGNHFFRINDDLGLKTSLEYYMRSIAYGIPGSKEVALTYANRSAVLLKLKRFNECLEDIATALQANYPKDLKPKLYVRRAECYSKMARDSYIDAKQWLSKVPVNDPKLQSLKGFLKEYPSSKEKERNIDEENVIPELKNPSKKFPCASDAVDVKYSNEFGRHIVATRNIDIGEILIVDKPYFQELDDELYFANCSHCMGFMWRGVACDHCVNVAYCSESCKIIAWETYHKLECNILDLLEKYGQSSVAITGVRFFSQMLNEAGGLDKLSMRVDAFEDKKSKKYF